jgi:hypothetical protein
MPSLVFFNLNESTVNAKCSVLLFVCMGDRVHVGVGHMIQYVCARADWIANCPMSVRDVYHENMFVMQA